MDFRSFHPFHDVGTQHIINELYLKDMELELVPGQGLLQVQVWCFVFYLFVLAPNVPLPNITLQ